MNFKNFKVIFIFTVMFLLCNMNNTIFAYGEPTVLEDVKVYIDGEEFVPQNSFYTYQYNTLAPMREFFEELGADVSWDEASRTVIARLNNDILTIKIDSKIIRLNDKVLEQKVQPQIINDSTYVPLRLVAESFAYEVDWNGIDKIITLADLSELREDKQLDHYISSSHFDDEYLELEIEDGNKLRVSGKLAKKKNAGMLYVHRIADMDDEEDYVNFDEVDEETSVIEKFKLDNDNSFDLKCSLEDILEDGKYEVSLFFQAESRKDFDAIFYDIILISEDNELYFPTPLIYANNYFHQLITSNMKPENYLSLDLNENDKLKITELVETIIAGEDEDYQKALKINDWISDNIYYDMDAYFTGDYGCVDAIGTLESKRSVCQGYAELTKALMRATGIPCRIVIGKGLGLSSNGCTWEDFTEEELKVSNHAWNEVYVDGRWIILDVTWNSNNEYIDGEFINKESNYRYFDSDLRAFSIDHKYID